MRPEFMLGDPGKCRFCRCTERDACRLAEGDRCCWLTQARNCCNNPVCVKARAAEWRARKARVLAQAEERRRKFGRPIRKIRTAKAKARVA